MNSFWKKIVQDFMSFSRSDRNAVIIIGSLILLVIIANAIVLRIPAKPNSDFSEFQSIFEYWEKAEAEKKEPGKVILFDFDPNTISTIRLDSLSIPDYVKRNLLSYRNAGGSFKSSADLRKIYGMNDSVFVLVKNHIKIKEDRTVTTLAKPEVSVKPLEYFDPNIIDKAGLKQLGFNEFQANNLINYRSKGSVFKVPSDLLKIYGIDSSFYFRMKEYINIERNEISVQSEEIIVLELNEADLTDLTKLNGVGPAFANRIIKYRSLLGGFYTKEQLNEVYNFPEETYARIKDHITVDTTRVNKIRINFSEYSELLRHPYLSKKQVEALLSWRQKNGAFTNISELKYVSGFDSEIIKKIDPYITCR
ncbi:helix-hairpin-helix domain-containing protein [Prolixibacteraceae bacterium Z1-6]|uniref:Helix-hairpin-helix domain-containing protein n=1 Tax=Draconibacterium aestuarii TaxID=2998507 RepID=A0A9X3F788_9BACT|nr:helix-hairpin-helix domain-containing protein [Prolixibacteraceae bacterium Z1-6]